jgi:hypothetical protein
MIKEIAWMNSLTNHFFGSWVIEANDIGVPRILGIYEKGKLYSFKNTG